MTKYIFVTGGVVSGVGKGIIASSIGHLLISRKVKVNIIKLDPYLNVNPGTMSPGEHGEVFVTEDGAETDMDLGHYERFLDIPMRSVNNTTSGKIYHSVITNERQGSYLGQTVQIIPHVINEIKRQINLAADNDTEILIVEVGGTVGDIEAQPFLETVRQIILSNEGIVVHVTLLPVLGDNEEIKTKPTQHSMKEIRALGIQPDFLICRCKKQFDNADKKKLALFSNVKEENIFCSPNVDNIYSIPLLLHAQALDTNILKSLNISVKEIDLHDWQAVSQPLTFDKTLRIAVLNKYKNPHESYKSLCEALYHASKISGVNMSIKFIEIIGGENSIEQISDVDGIIIPGGFDRRGTDFYIQVIEHCRNKNVPFLGICLGMQCAVIEFAKNVVGLKEASSTEFNSSTPHPVVTILEASEKDKNVLFGGKMNLGSQEIKIEKDSLAYRIYGEEVIHERFRHRYEINPAYEEALTSHGLRITGRGQNNRVNIIELPSCDFFIAVQFHPEFVSRPTRSHKLFLHFIRSCT